MKLDAYLDVDFYGVEIIFRRAGMCLEISRFANSGISHLKLNTGVGYYT
jgi:hypothetical protein